MRQLRIDIDPLGRCQRRAGPATAVCTRAAMTLRILGAREGNIFLPRFAHDTTQQQIVCEYMLRRKLDRWRLYLNSCCS